MVLSVRSFSICARTTPILPLSGTLCHRSSSWRYAAATAGNNRTAASGFALSYRRSSLSNASVSLYSVSRAASSASVSAMVQISSPRNRISAAEQRQRRSALVAIEKSSGSTRSARLFSGTTARCSVSGSPVPLSVGSCFCAATDNVFSQSNDGYCIEFPLSVCSSYTSIPQLRTNCKPSFPLIPEKRPVWLSFPNRSYTYRQRILYFRRILSAIIAINSELVGLPRLFWIV